MMWVEERRLDIFYKASGRQLKGDIQHLFNG